MTSTSSRGSFPWPEGEDEPFGGLRVQDIRRPSGRYEYLSMRWGSTRYHSPEFVWAGSEGYSPQWTSPEERRRVVAELERVIDEIMRNHD